MTISTTIAKSRYAGDGGTTSFPTGFKFLDPDHVRVLLRHADGSEVLWTEGSEYALAGAGQPGGGTVTAITSPIDHTPPVGTTLVVMLAVPARQDTALPLGGAFPSTAVEAIADLAALRDQQLAEALSRAPKFKATTALADVEFPEPEAGKPVGWNADGDALLNLAGIGRWQGDWQTATDYVALDVVRDPVTKNVYVCELAHASGDFGDDLAAGVWSLAINVEDAEAAATAAAAAHAAAEAAQSAAQAAEADAAASASAAEASETNASDSATAAAGSAAAALSAATAAQTAKTNAEAAETAAEAAQAAAETAETNAEAASATATTQAGTATTQAAAAAASAAAAEALYEDLEAIDTAVTAAQAAQAGAETAETNAETARAAAESAEGNAETAATAAATSAGTAASEAAAAADSASAAASAAAAATMAQNNAEAGQAAAEAALSAAETAETNAETAATAAAASAAEVEDTKLIWQGDWSVATAYAVNDAVAHDGASWICIETHTNHEPPNAAYWNVLAAKGEQGFQGIQGEQGIQGDPGDDGVGIVPQGAYGAGTSYDLDDGVTYEGSFWRSLQNANQGNTPTSSPSHWEETVEKGDTGPAADTVIMLAVSDEATAITAGAGKLTFRMPMAFTLSAVRASLATASSSGAVTVDINENGATILSTKLTIDQGEKTSTTAAPAAVISDASLADDAEITVDIDGAGTDAAGLKVTLIGVPA